MSITVVEKSLPSITINSMEVGDYGRIETGPYVNHIVLRIWNDQVVSLTNPKVIWNVNEQNYVHVHIFTKGSTLTVPVGLISGEVHHQVGDLLATNDKIGAIKALKAATNLGLKDAKDYVDNYSNQPDPDPLPF